MIGDHHASVQLREICISTKTTTETLTNTVFMHALDMTLCAHITINKNGYFTAHPRQCTTVVPVNNIDLAGSSYLYRC